LEGDEEDLSAFSFVILARFTYTQLYLESEEQFSSGDENTCHINITTSQCPTQIYHHHAPSSSSNSQEIQPLVQSEIQLLDNWNFDWSSRLFNYFNGPIHTHFLSAVNCSIILQTVYIFSQLSFLRKDQ
jgi:hypothetical protein